jgi:hypothetical protein
MKTTLFAFSLIILSLTTGCKNSKSENNSSLPIFDLGASITKQVPDTLTWNSIAKKITYVPISTSSDALFAWAMPVYIGEDFNCMVDHKTNTIFRTDKKGNVINSFSRKGQGPGEYGMISYVHVCLEDSTIRVLDQRGNKCIIYDFEGNLIKSILLKDKGINTPILMSDSYLVARGGGYSDHKLYITDEEANIKQSLFPMDTTLTEINRMVLASQINFCKNRDLALVHFANEDTVFAVTQSGAEPLCIFEKGGYQLSYEDGMKMMDPQASPYMRTMWISSIPNYYLITYMLKLVFYDEIWSKVDNQIKSRVPNKAGAGGFQFALPSGKKIRFNSRSLYIHGNTVATYIDAVTAAEEGVAGVSEDDNPVLVIMEL